MTVYVVCIYDCEQHLQAQRALQAGDDLTALEEVTKVVSYDQTASIWQGTRLVCKLDGPDIAFRKSASLTANPNRAKRNRE